MNEAEIRARNPGAAEVSRVAPHASRRAVQVGSTHGGYQYAVRIHLRRDLSGMPRVRADDHVLVPDRPDCAGARRLRAPFAGRTGARHASPPPPPPPARTTPARPPPLRG